MFILLVIILLLLCVGSLPTWPYASGWGMYPAGGFGFLLLLVILFLLFGHR